ncbi:PucR family transcriptional regulator [Kineococcus terrestris]|uniref:PucR family transcriptional regulator n=1 Tax=Kineococcus terrestris TaxID=2044856 RepID=UPI0034DB542C
MPLTVADVLALPVVAAGDPRVVVGGPGLGAAVRWVHVTEQTDLTGLLGGGELLLSTGIGLGEPGFDAAGYVASLREAGAVGLVVELGRHLARLPAPLVGAAREARFPLVELTRAVRFVAVTEQVHATVLHQQYERLRFSERVHEAFASLATGGGTVAEVLDRAAALTGRVVVLEDPGHHAVAHAGASAADALRDWPARSRRADAAEGWPTAPVGPVGARWGRLVVPERVAEPVAAPAPSPSPGASAPAGPGQVRLVLTRAAEALTVARLLDPGAGDPAQHAAARLLRDLLRGRASEEEDLRARARALGLPARARHVPLAVHAPPPAEPGAVADAVAAVLARGRTGGLSGVVGPRLVGVLLAVPAEAPGGGGGAADPARAAADRFAAQLLREVRGRAAAGPPGAAPPVDPPAPVVAAAGTGAAGTLAAAGEGLAEAVHVARAAAGLPHRAPGTVHRAADLGARGLLWWLRGDPRLAAYVEEQLSPLLTGSTGAPDGPDGPGAGEQLELLRAWLEEGGSATRLARRLHLSRPAVYARVERLRARLGRPLDDPETRLSLHLALLARDAAGGDPGGG